jgi:hypothetical protein
MRTSWRRSHPASRINTYPFRTPYAEGTGENLTLEPQPATQLP